jgi:hypothetical protein
MISARVVPKNLPRLVALEREFAQSHVLQHQLIDYVFTLHDPAETPVVSSELLLKCIDRRHAVF